MKPRLLCLYATMTTWAGLVCGESFSWTQLLPANNPPARVCAASAYDTATGLFALYGGNGPGLSTSFNDTWVWGGKTTAWTQLQPAS